MDHRLEVERATVVQVDTANPADRGKAVLLWSE